MRIRPLLIAILIIQTASSSFSQQPQPQSTPPPPPQMPQTKPEDVDVVRITTNLVQVDAVVTDSHGKVVTDLKPEEVEIYEDGHKQKITHFNYYSAENATATSTAKPPAPSKNAPAFPPKAQCLCGGRSRNSWTNKCSRAIWWPSFAPAEEWAHCSHSPRINV